MNVTIEEKSASVQLASIPAYSFFIHSDLLYMRLPDANGRGTVLYFGDGGEPRVAYMHPDDPGCVLAEVDVVARPE